MRAKSGHGLIVRQMLRKVRIEEAGDTELLPMELFDRFEFEEINARTIAAGGEPATAQTMLLRVAKASLSTPTVEDRRRSVGVPPE